MSILTVPKVMYRYLRTRKNCNKTKREKILTQLTSLYCRNKLFKARENEGGYFMLGLSFASDWLREWREFSGPITE